MLYPVSNIRSCSNFDRQKSELFCTVGLIMIIKTSVGKKTNIERPKCEDQYQDLEQNGKTDIGWSWEQRPRMVHSVSGWSRGVQVKLWDPLRTRAIPECLRGAFTTRRYTNPRLPLPLPNWSIFSCCCFFLPRMAGKADWYTKNPIIFVFFVWLYSRCIL